MKKDGMVLNEKKKKKQKKSSTHERERPEMAGGRETVELEMR